MITSRPTRPVQPTNAISSVHESRCMIFTGKDTARALKDPSEISELLKDEHNFVWFDLAEPTQDDLRLLQEEFSLHPTAIEDAALEHERPKIEAFHGYRLVVLHATTVEAGELVLHEIAIFVGKNFLVTIRAHPAYPLDEIERRWQARATIPHTSAGLLYVILDVVVDGYHPVASVYDERLVALENLVLARRGRDPERVLHEVSALKRDLVRLRHAVAPVRDILAPMVRGEIDPGDTGIITYFRDVHDHALRVTDQIDSIRELLNSTLDIHLSTEAHRQGEVSKQLTIIATIFLPLAFITGFFGQNFGWMVAHIDKPEHFWYIGVGTQLLAVVILVGYFKRKGWF